MIFADERIPFLRPEIVLRDYQIEARDRAFELFQSHPGVLVRLPTGCHRKGQLVMTWTGECIPVEDVQQGDWLMGPDGRPRTVMQLARGRGRMVRIKPVKGNSFVVNEDHILTLVRTNVKGVVKYNCQKSGGIVDVSVKEWMKWSKTKKHEHKLFRVGVEFQAQNNPWSLDPYFLGVILGDGHIAQSEIVITTADEVIVEEVYRQAARYTAIVKIDKHNNSGKAESYHIRTSPAMPLNLIRQEISGMGLSGCRSHNKFVPNCYKLSSRSCRLSILAGLIDTDGSLSTGGYDYISKSKQLSEDVAFIARSLGLAAYVKICCKASQNGTKGTYYRVSISGQCDIIPCRIARKIPAKRTQKKSVLRTGFSVEMLGEEDFFGFILDGDHRYLLDDFTVTHNTGKTLTACAIADQWLQMGDSHHVMIMSHERQLVMQFADEVQKFLDYEPGIEMGNRRVDASYMPKIVVASRASLYVKQTGQMDEEGLECLESRLHKFDPFLNWLVILDETHLWAYKLKSCAAILQWFEANPNSRRIGLTATPLRSDKTSLAKMFPAFASDYRLFDISGGPCAVRDGWAVPYEQHFVTVEGVDFKALRVVAKDYDEHHLEELLCEANTLARFVDPTLDIVGNRRTLIFSPTKNMAKMVAEYINSKIPESAAELDGDANDITRNQIYRQFADGTLQFLSVCGLCRAGYNNPEIQAVAIFRPTKSKVLAEQMKGRGCRPLQGILAGLETAEQRKAAIAASKKPTCLIVDLVGVTGLGDCATTAHLLGEGKPDEVIERANENATKKGTGVDMAQEILTAEQELAAEEAERERLKKEREEAAERNRLAMEEFRAKAAEIRRLESETRYQSHIVKQGGSGLRGQQQRQQRRPAFIFGKYKGHSISMVPIGYLKWFAQNVPTAPGWLLNEVRQEIQARSGAAPRKQSSFFDDLDSMCE